MAWKIEFTDEAVRNLRKLDRAAAQRIILYMSERVSTRQNPRTLGRALMGSMGGLWRYRVGEFRAICNIQDDVMRILVIRIGNRKNVYDK